MLFLRNPKNNIFTLITILVSQIFYLANTNAQDLELYLAPPPHQETIITYEPKDYPDKEAIRYRRKIQKSWDIKNKPQNIHQKLQNIYRKTQIKPKPLADLIDHKKKKWHSHISLDLRTSSSRDIVSNNFFVPLWQGSNYLNFLNLIATGDNNENYEGNFGIGTRKIYDDRFILGLYSFFDIRKTQNDNKFKQITLGAELLTNEWDLRTNFYLPENKNFALEEANTARFSGNNILIRNGYEQAMTGLDFEVGHSVFTPKIRAFLGGYYFFHNEDSHENQTLKTQDMTGGRARIEVRPWDILQLDFSAQDDDIRGANHFLGAKFIMHFATKKHRNKLSALEKRMSNDIVRDIDIISAQLLSEEAPLLSQNGQEQKILFVDNTVSSSGDGSFSEPFQSLKEAESNSSEYDMIYVYAGDQTSNHYDQGLILKDNQKLFGQGSDFVINNVTLIPASSHSVITNTNLIADSLVTNTNKTSGITLGNHNEIAGIKVSYIDRGVSINGVNKEGANIHDSIIEPSSFVLIYSNIQSNYNDLLNGLYDVAILDAGSDVDGLSVVQINQLQGQGKKLFAYRSIGEINDSEAAKNGWSEANPASFFVVKDGSIFQNSGVGFNSFYVDYTHQEWVNYVKNDINNILTKGYDGVMLDTVLTYDTFVNAGSALANVDGNSITQDLGTSAQNMRNFIIDLSRNAKSQNGDFSLIPNGGIGLIADTDGIMGSHIVQNPNQEYIDSIDGILKESLFYDAGATSPKSDTLYSTQLLDYAVSQDKSIFLLDFPGNESSRCNAMDLSEGHNYLQYPTTDQLFNTIYTLPSGC